MQSNTNNPDGIDTQYRLDIIQHQSFLEFLWKYLKPQLDKKDKEPFTILEVGCGNGVFAKLLLNRVKEHQLPRSLEYTAIDPVSDCVNRATELGINAFASDFFSFVEGKENLRYDMILFTKSLHHVLPVDKAVALASSCLKEHGVFIADEFDRTLADEETARWFFESSELLQAADVFDLSKVTHHMHVHAQGEPHQHAPHSHSHSHSHSHGHGEHHQCKHSAKIEPQDSSFLSKFNTMFLRHELATWAQIQKAVKDTFDEVQVTENLPSLFTMFAPRLVISDSGEKALKTLMKIEEERIRDKHLMPIGVRIIATHHKGEL